MEKLRNLKSNMAVGCYLLPQKCDSIIHCQKVGRRWWNQALPQLLGAGKFWELLWSFGCRDSNGHGTLRLVMIKEPRGMRKCKFWLFIKHLDITLWSHRKEKCKYVSNWKNKWRWKNCVASQRLIMASAKFRNVWVTVCVFVCLCVHCLWSRTITA